MDPQLRVGTVRVVGAAGDGSVPIALEWTFTSTSAALAAGSDAPNATSAKYRIVRS